MDTLTTTTIALIKKAIEKQLSDYIDESDNDKYNFIVGQAVDSLKEDFEISEDFDVTPEEVEEHFEEFIKEWVKDVADYDATIWTLPNGEY